MQKNSREIALKVLNEINEHGAYSNISLNRNIGYEISSLDDSLIRELVYGVLENKLFIDWIILKFSKIKFKKISPYIRDIIRLGIYQIMFMDRIPDSAAVNESVKLAKKYGHKGSLGYVNGLLRNVTRNKDTIELPDKENNPNEYLSIKYSHPKWMIDEWVNEYGFDFTEALCIANNKKPSLNIRVNTLKNSIEELMKSLREKGFIVHRTVFANDGLVIDNPARITDTEEFKNGYFQIQDESSMLVAQIMDPKEGSFVIDVCSAPGGKTTHIAQMMKNKGKIIARDVYDHKLNLIKENCERLDINIIETQLYNALRVDNKLIEKADYCLVDAPCSGLGLLRRKPDIRWNKDLDNLNEITELQYKILENSSKYVRKEGILVYSTCTINRDENINLVRKFINNNPEFKLINFKGLVNDLDEIVDNVGYIELFPNTHGTDGFFIAKMIKI
ncbi:16S rRNA (cytosine(967)-C(5))-methyltransferase RsmB [Brassicibacter mesophilus]|uniref:16S rRNA (cytosine(967)-C(5))-methyltransferase RsmB n=1 Tax=Brassicibacter mesophilus TaxID=745119 RepID=UPI003D21B653